MVQEQINEVILDGKRYISVRRAADLTSYASDYIGQLCRGGKIGATRIGRNWYVEESSIIEHKTLNSDKKKGAPFNSVGIEQNKKDIFKNAFVMYSKDDSPLFPDLGAEKVKSNKKDKGNKVILNITQEIFTKIKEDEEEKTNSVYDLSNIMNSFRQVASVSAAFIVMFVGIFSLNATYTMTTVANSATAFTSSVINTQFARTIDKEIVDKYEFVAREISHKVNNTVYEFLYFSK